MEIEIRAGAVIAVEEIRETLLNITEQKIFDALSLQLDWHLWETYIEREDSLPFHRVRTMFY